MQVFDEGEDPLLDGAVHLPGGEVMEHAPLELTAVDTAVANLHVFGKDALKGQPEHGSLPGPGVVRVVQIMDEHQIGHLFDDIQRIGQTACPEDFPKAVNFTSQFTCHHSFIPSPSSIYRMCSGLRRS